MRTTDEILIDNQMIPTMLHAEERARLQQYLSLAAEGSRSALAEPICEAVRAVRQTEDALLSLAEALLSPLDEALRQIASILTWADGTSVFTYDAAALTKRHVRLVRAIHKQTLILSEAANHAVRARQNAEETILSPLFLTNLLLLRAALREVRPRDALISVLSDLVQSPSPVEDLSALLEQGESLLSEIGDHLTSLLAISSDTITAVNKGKQPATEYLRLLRRVQIRLHDLKESVNRMKNEVQHVKISDVL